jgi:hypothetical protein
MRASFLSLFLLLGVLSCAEAPTASDGSFDDVVNTWLSDEGTTRGIDCGALAACSPDNDAVKQAVVTCLLDAWTDCDPVSVSWTQSTVEGDLLHYRAVPVDLGSKCTVAMFTDTRSDAFGGPSIKVQTCGQLTASEDQCPGISLGSCDDSTTLTDG